MWEVSQSVNVVGFGRRWERVGLGMHPITTTCDFSIISLECFERVEGKICTVPVIYILIDKATYLTG
jgi:hypothetical protein